MRQGAECGALQVPLPPAEKPTDILSFLLSHACSPAAAAGCIRAGGAVSAKSCVHNATGVTTFCMVVRPVPKDGTVISISEITTDVSKLLSDHWQREMQRRRKIRRHVQAEADRRQRRFLVRRLISLLPRHAAARGPSCSSVVRLWVVNRSLNHSPYAPPHTGSHVARGGSAADSASLLEQPLSVVACSALCLTESSSSFRLSLPRSFERLSMPSLRSPLCVSRRGSWSQASRWASRFCAVASLMPGAVVRASVNSHTHASAGVHPWYWHGLVRSPMGDQPGAAASGVARGQVVLRDSLFPPLRTPLRPHDLIPEPNSQRRHAACPRGEELVKSLMGFRVSYRFLSSPNSASVRRRPRTQRSRGTPSVSTSPSPSFWTCE